MNWFNLGLWDGASSHSEACRALARRLGHAAGLGPGQRVFDAGCGGGGQLEVWLDDYQVDSVVAVDASSRALDEARRLVHAHPRGGRVQLEQVQLPTRSGVLVDGLVDRVLCLDAAYHFDTRAMFFAQARRCLAPGGSIALVDLVLTPAGAQGLEPGQKRWLSKLIDVPVANMVDVTVYREQLQTSGFQEPTLVTLDAPVLGGFVNHVASGAYRRAFPARLWPMVKGTARLFSEALARDWLRCVLTTAATRSP